MAASRRWLVTDERGAIMVVALFMAVFLVGILYYGIGIGQAILRREAMQDAADGAALAAAVTHARGMNLIVLVNMVMAALLAVLVTIRLVQGLCIVGMAVAAGLAFPSMGASLVVVPPLKAVHGAMQSSYETLEPPIHAALEVLHTTSDHVSTMTPLVAHGIAQQDVDPAIELVVAPLPAALPVTDDSFGKLCGKAGEYAAHVWMLPLDKLPGFSFVGDALGGAVSALTTALAQWFCGDSGNAPSYSRTGNESYPRSFGIDACVDSTLDPIAATVEVEDAKTRICTEAEEKARASAPNTETGECQPVDPDTGQRNDCGLSGPYETRVREARVACAPTSSPRPVSYQYQTQSGKVTYQWNGREWLRGEPEYEQPKFEPRPGQSRSQPPCGTRNALIAEGYNTRVHPDDDPTTILPVCHDEQPPRPLDARTPRFPPPTQVVRFTQVTHILGCAKKITRTHTWEGEPMGTQANDKTSKTVPSTMVLGDENFQLRAIVATHTGASSMRDGVRPVLWNQTPPENPISELLPHGRFAFAQSEFFYDGKGAREEWMWNMSWRARLRVFRLDEQASAAAQKACDQQTGADVCDGIFATLTAFADVLVH